MKKVAGIAFLVLMMIGFSTSAQPGLKNNTVMLYDPSFWKAELKLNGFQYRKMQEINEEFYKRLINAYKEMHDDRKAFQLAYAQCWINRNTQLWETMNYRQQRKWKKMVEIKHMGEGEASGFVGLE